MTKPRPYSFERIFSVGWDTGICDCMSLYILKSGTCDMKKILFGNRHQENAFIFCCVDSIKLVNLKKFSLPIMSFNCFCFESFLVKWYRD